MVPRYERPDPPLPEAWSTPAQAASPACAAPCSRWWESFGSAELSTLVTQGTDASFTLQAAAQRIEQAKAIVAVASAPLYPSLEAGASVASNHETGAARPQSIFVQASYELDFWGKNRAAAASAGALAQASEFDRDTTLLTLTSSVADTYFQALSFRERIRLARDIAANATRLLKLVEIQAAGGIASELEIAQQRNAVATFEANVATLERQSEQNLHALAVLVGRNPEAFSVSGGALQNLAVPAVAPGLPATVLRQRPDVRSAEARLVSANFDVGASRAAFFPDIALTGEAGISNGALAHFFPATHFDGIAVSLLQPLFEGGRLTGKLRFDEAHVRELVANYRQAVVAALQDVEDALTAVERLRELEAIQQVAVDSARRAENLAEVRFRYGTATFINVLDSERVRSQAEDALLQVRLQRLQAAVGLYRALGGGFDERAMDAVGQG
jgi:NodT family efflux transporter outer membrane factor (OMF) lipoprotein